VKDEVDRHVGVRQLHGAHHRLGIVDVDVPHDREAEKIHRLLPVHEQDDARLSFELNDSDEPFAGRFEQSLSNDRLEGRKHEK